MQHTVFVQPLAVCKCGASADGPKYCVGNRGWIAVCSRKGCPAIVVRPSKAEAAEAWNGMATRLNK